MADLSAHSDTTVLAWAEQLKAVATEQVELADAAGRRWLHLTGADASKRLWISVAPGRYFLRWFDDDRLLAEEPILVDAGDSVPVSLKTDD